MRNRNPLTRVSSHAIHEGALVSVREDQVKVGAGPEHSFTAITFKVCGVCVLPIDSEGKTRLVGQHRYVADRYTWELVRGAGDPSDPLGAAKRELSEETGLKARSWLKVMDLMASPGLTDEFNPCFIAWEVEQGSQHTEESEQLQIRKLTLNDAVNLVLSGEIKDAPSRALILCTQVLAHRGALPSDLAALLT